MMVYFYEHKQTENRVTILSIHVVYCRNLSPAMHKRYELGILDGIMNIKWR